MQKIKNAVRVYGLYLVIAIVMFAGGVFYGRMNIIIVSETQWDKLVRSAQAIEQMQADAELQRNLSGME